MKGQGSTEYLVILAVVLVVALIVIGLLGQFTEFGSSGLEQQSKSYWQAATPFSILNVKMNSTEVKLEVQNKLYQRLNVTEVKFGDDIATASDINATNGGAGVIFAPGQTQILTSVDYVTPCSATGQTYQINLYGKCS